jgi:polysaccharide chain length determinant protein (PEP-CTERM system associated)
MPDMDYRDYLEVLGRRKWIIVVSFVTVFFGASAYLVMTPSLYKSTTTILVISPLQSTGNRESKIALSTIEQQVTSRTRLMKVREELGLFAKKEGEQLQDVVYENMKKRIEIDVLQDQSRTGGRGDGSKEGFSISYVDIDPKQAMLAASRLASLFIEESLKTRERQVVTTSNLLESQLKETKAELEAQEEKVKRYKMQNLGELPQELQSNLANLGNLQDQYRVNADGIRTQEQKMSLLQSQLSVIERGTQTIVHKDGREEVDTSLDTTQALITELTNRRNQLAELTAKYTERHPDVIRMSEEVDQLEKKLAGTPKSLRTTHQNEKDIPDNRQYLPLAGREREESLRLRAQIESAKVEVDALKRERNIIKGKIAGLQGQISRVPRHEQELVALTRDYDNLKISYNDLVKKKQEADIAEDRESRQKGEQFQILDPANFPEKPFKPKKRKVFLLAFLLASGLGFGGAIVLEGGDRTLRGAKDFQHFFNLKVFACIPDIDEEADARRKTLQLVAILGGGLLFFAGVLVLLWFYEDRIRILLKI